MYLQACAVKKHYIKERIAVGACPLGVDASFVGTFLAACAILYVEHSN